MSYKAIISDWNGTLINYPSDELLHKKIAYAIANDLKSQLFKGEFWKIVDVMKLVRTKGKLKKRLREFNSGERHLQDVYDIFNDEILKGKPVKYITGIIDRFAKEFAKKLDSRVLRPIQAVHKEGASTGILSASFGYSIDRILKEAGYSRIFDDIVSNDFLVNEGKVLGITLDIYEKKAEFLHSEFFDKRGLRENNTLYLGDTKDDEPIAKLLAPGNFIVPFFAPDEFKEKMASKYKAFVPETEQDLLKYLQDR